MISVIYFKLRCVIIYGTLVWCFCKVISCEFMISDCVIITKSFFRSSVTSVTSVTDKYYN